MRCSSVAKCGVPPDALPDAPASITLNGPSNSKLKVRRPMPATAHRHGTTIVLLATMIGGLTWRGVTAEGPRPLSPSDERATFRLPAGFRIELAAAEPDVVDPVAMAFDEDGRLIVAEMRGYPNGGVGTGVITSGRIKVLEDADGDGYYEKSRVFADKLRFPTGVMPWRGGLLVAVAPDIVVLEDTHDSGQADRRRVLYTGFDLANIQQLVNSLQWGLDNWVHGCAGGAGGTIRSPEKTEAAPVNLRGRGIRFHPEVPGSLEPTSGGGQYGLAADEWEHWFTATNSQHLRHIVMPDHYLRRNPALAVPAVTLDIADHGAACKVFRRSPFEAWRVERTTRRKDGPDSRRFPSTELVPGGYITSACSPVIYAADAFPSAYRGNAFVCDPANNLIHRDVLVDSGATFTARRAPGEESCEFLTSTDNWFRPVHLSLGPDGALYVLDFYRQVIETPLSLPNDIKKRLNLESRGCGRIWRIVADTPQAKEAGRRRPALRKVPTRELVRYLEDSNSWWRLAAQRLLVERQVRSAVEPLEELSRASTSPVARAHALWTLQGLNALRDEVVERALKDREPGVREQALRLCDDRLATSVRLRTAVAALADDPSRRVRFQLALTLGQGGAPELVTALAKVARRDGADSWVQTAVLSSAGTSAASLLTALADDRAFTGNSGPEQLQLLKRLASLVGARAGEADVAVALALLGTAGTSAEPWQVAILDGLGEGLQAGTLSPAQLWDHPPPKLRAAVARSRNLFEQAAVTSKNESRPLAERVAAVRLLGRGPLETLAAVAPELLAPQAPPELQLAVVRALSGHSGDSIAPRLLGSWSGYSPAVRREVVEALFARPERIPPLLAALEGRKILANQLEPLRIEQLRKLPDATLRDRACRLLARQAGPDRRAVVETYRGALGLKADAVRGRTVFKKTCTTCHRLENDGFEVGPDLLAALRNKSAEQLLSDLLDPSREVDPRFLNYVVTTRQGRTLSGLIVAETASGLTLRRGEKAEDTVLRSQIEDVQATGKSLMPEGLESQLSKQDVADLVAYLQSVAVPR
jgi:putative membrane-bound dehydrogenase-like protein